MEVKCKYGGQDEATPEVSGIAFGTFKAFETSAFKATEDGISCSVVADGGDEIPIEFFRGYEGVKYVSVVAYPRPGSLKPDGLCTGKSDQQSCEGTIGWGCTWDAEGNTCSMDCKKRTLTKDGCEIDLMCSFTPADGTNPATCETPPDPGNTLWKTAKVQTYNSDLPGSDDKNINIHLAQLVPDLPLSDTTLMWQDTYVRITVADGNAPEPPPAPTPPGPAPPTAIPQRVQASGYQMLMQMNHGPNQMRVMLSKLMSNGVVGATDTVLGFGPYGDEKTGVSPVPLALEKQEYTVTYERCNPSPANPVCGATEGAWATVPGLDAFTISADKLKEGESMLLQASGALDGLPDFKAAIGLVEDAQGAESAWHKPWPYIIIGIGVIVLLAVCGYFVYKRQQPKEEEAKPLLG